MERETQLQYAGASHYCGHRLGIDLHFARKAAASACVLALIVFLCAGSSFAQNQKKNKKDKSADNSASDSLVHLPDPQAIDHMISEMLGYWQIGDVDSLHKYFADDVTTISGVWEPPLFGWAAYANAYRAQHARTQSVRMDRFNTYTKVSGDTAWSTYQWKFSAQVDGKAASAVGHTTLALEKRNGAWVIVLNHTSEVATGGSGSPTTAAPVQPAPSTPAAHPGL